jgi:hypothetical protein
MKRGKIRRFITHRVTRKRHHYNGGGAADPVFADPSFFYGTSAQSETVTDGFITVAASLPAGAGTLQAGDKILAYCTSRHQYTSPEPPSGNTWHRSKMSQFWSDSNGTNIGAVMATTFTKTAAGGESGTISFKLPNHTTGAANALTVTLIVVRPVSGAKVTVNIEAGDFRIMDTAVGLPTIGASTPTSARAWNPQNLKTGDHIIPIGVANTNLYTFSSRNITVNAGLSMSTVSADVISSSLNAGNNQYVFASLFKITGGNQTDFITHTSTASSSGLRNPVLNIHFIRVRQVAAATSESYIPSGAEILLPENCPTADIDSGAGGRMAGEFDFEGGSATNRHGIETYAGEPHFYVLNRFDLHASRVDRRGEWRWAKWEPKWVPGTKYYEGIRTRQPLMIGNPDNQQFIFYQFHVGGSYSGPNHPTIFLEWCHDAQVVKVGANPDGTGGSNSTMPAGSLLVAIGKVYESTGGATPSVREYMGFPSISNVGSNRDHRFELMVKVGALGSGRVILRYNGTTIVDRTDIATMAELSEEFGSGIAGSNTGVTPNVGGQGKLGGYFHQVSTNADAETWYDALVAGGVTDGIWKRYDRAHKRAVKHPYDSDYDDANDTATLDYVSIT